MKSSALILAAVRSFWLVLVFAIVAVLGGTAVSAPIQLKLSSQSSTSGTSGGSPAPGATLRLYSNSTFTPPALVIAGPQPDDIDRMLNYQIGDPTSFIATVRKDQATALGLDWDAFESKMLGSNRSISLIFQNGSSGTSASTYMDVSTALRANFSIVQPLRLTEFEMEEIRLKVDYYFWHPVLTTLRATKLTIEIDGRGSVVPEPATLCSLMLACVMIGLRHRRAHRPA